MCLGSPEVSPTGKSTVSRHLRRLGAYVIDADKVAHQVTMPGTPGYLKVVERFGGEVVTPEGALDRKALGRIVFGDREALSALNSIVHPLVIEETHNMLDGLDRCFAGAVHGRVLCWMYLSWFEAGIDRICGRNMGCGSGFGASDQAAQRTGRLFQGRGSKQDQIPDAFGRKDSLC